MPFYSSQRREWKEIRHAFATAHLELRRLRLAVALKRFNPSQPRVPAGNPDGGQWTSGGGGGNSEPSSEREGAARRRSPGLRLAGGFAKEDLNMSVQSFAVANCKGRIRSVLPQQFLDSTIADVMQAAKKGDRAARTCLKILSRDEYRK